MDATVSEIHAYPLRPAGFAEPLFHTRQSRRLILQHLANSNWLFRASEAPRPAERKPDRALCPAASGAMASDEYRVIASWREVDRWWEPDGGVDVIWRRVESRCGRQEVRAEPVRGPTTEQQTMSAV